MVQFSEEKLNKVKEIMARYPEGKQKSAVIPVLHIAQEEFDGWLDVSVMDYVAELLNITPIEVYEVATFYTMFNLKRWASMCWRFAKQGLACSMAVMV